MGRLPAGSPQIYEYMKKCAKRAGSGWPQPKVGGKGQNLEMLWLMEMRWLSWGDVVA
jgi:hypothetical protein